MITFNLLTSLLRYRDVNPYDHTRIVLKRKTPDGIDYINANFVKLEKAKRQYVLCQGPLEHTVGHFWLMGMLMATYSTILITDINFRTFQYGNKTRKQF